VSIIEIQKQLDENRRSVGFDSYDITVKQLYDMILEKMIDIAPEYQRHFVWKADRQSALIESLLLGIPVPSLFMATNKDATWDVVDGVQRLRTILNFIGNEEDLKKVGIEFKQLKLSNLEKLDAMNGVVYEDLPKSMQFMFQTRPLRITVLNDRSDFNLRYDLFERLNTGGVILNPQEIRNCVFLGEFNAFIKKLSQDENFRAVVKMAEKTEGSRDRNYEELVLRFFAYYEDQENYVKSVKGFLNKFMEKKTKSFKNKDHFKKIFSETFKCLNKNLPNGIVRDTRKNMTPAVLYEAISVGTAIALENGVQVKGSVLINLLNDKELKKCTTGATNSKKMLFERINMVRDRLSNAV